MTNNYDPSLHPRGNPDNAGQFIPNTPTPTDLVIPAPSAPDLGQFPVNLADYPNVANYRFTASALAKAPGGALVPYFSEQEFWRLTEVTNVVELESDDPLVIELSGSEFRLRNTGTEETFPLPSIDTAGGKIWALDTHGGNTEFELTEGEWAVDGPVQKNATEILSDDAVGDTFDRSWTVRRDDGEFITRTVTWFVEECDYSDMVDINVDGDRAVNYSVFRRTEDFTAPEFHGDLEQVDNPFNEDHLADGTVYDTVDDAQDAAERLARHADADLYLDGWDGY